MLYLVQHGEAVSKDVDPERPLADRGAGDVDNLATCLVRAGVAVSTIYHSGKMRAQQTADILAEHITPDRASMQMDGIGATDATDAIAADLAQWPEGVVLVSHMPFVGRLTGRLTAGDEHRPPLAFLPGSAAALELTGDDGWIVAWMLRPELLR